MKQSLKDYLYSKILDGSSERYQAKLEPFYIAKAYVGDSIEEYFTGFQENNTKKYVKIFDTLDYTPTPILNVKKFGSVYAKIYDGGYEEGEIFTKMPDIVRGRIVCRTLNQLKFLKKNLVQGYLIQKKRLRLIKVKNYSKKPTPQGYNAINYQLLIPKKILKTSQDIRFELQLMTEMQHTWVELSHVLFYKNMEIEKERVKFAHAQMRRISDMISVMDEMYEDIREDVKTKSRASK